MRDIGVVGLGVDFRVVIQRCIAMWDMGEMGRRVTMFMVRRWMRVGA